MLWNDRNHTLLYTGKSKQQCSNSPIFEKNNNECTCMSKLKQKKHRYQNGNSDSLYMLTLLVQGGFCVPLTSLYFINFSTINTCNLHNSYQNNDSSNIMLKSVKLFLLSKALTCWFLFSLAWKKVPSMEKDVACHHLQGRSQWDDYSC